MDNLEALSYAEVAMANCGMSPLSMDKVLVEMRRLFDEYTEDEIVEQARRIRK